MCPRIIARNAAPADELPFNGTPVVKEQRAEHIRRVLEEDTFDMELAQMGEESPFDEDAHYEAAEIDDAVFQAEWRQFEKSLSAESRHFNKSAEAVLDLIFEDIVGAKTSRGQPVIRAAGPGTDIAALYRARVFQTEDLLESAIKFR